MTEHVPETQEGGTWGSREAAAEWRRGAAVRAQVFGPATEMMLDLAKVDAGSRVLDIGAGAGDSTLAAAQRGGPNGRVLATAREAMNDAGLQPDWEPSGRPGVRRPVRSGWPFRPADA